MTRLKTDDDYATYVCGRCRGRILFLKRNGRPRVCPECGYGHGTRLVNDVPLEVKISLNNPSTSEDGSRGITEKTTITSR